VSPLRRSALGALVAALAACGTEDAPDPLAPSGPIGRVRFVNVINDTTRGRVNAILENVPFGVNLIYGQSTPAALPAPSTAPYAAILAGARTLVLKRTADTNTVVATFNPTIEPERDYSVYAIGGSGASAVASFVTTDTNSVPAAGQVRVRVVNLSPTAGAVDVFITAENANLATATPSVANLAYQRASAYLTLAAATFQVRAVPAGTAPANRATSVVINVATLAIPSLGARTIVLADRNLGGAPLTAFALTDR
jgi:hypothetical protein